MQPEQATPILGTVALEKAGLGAEHRDGHGAHACLYATDQKPYPGYGCLASNCPNEVLKRAAAVSENLTLGR